MIFRPGMDRCRTLINIFLAGTILTGCGNMQVNKSNPFDVPTQQINEMQLITSAPTTVEIPISTGLDQATIQNTDMPIHMEPTPTQLPCGTDWCITYGHFLFQRPINSANNDKIERSYPFGSTLNGERDVHHGVEFTNLKGTPVLAVGDGKVVAAGSDHLTEYGYGTDFYGNLVMIEHHQAQYSVPIYTLYGHLNSIDVQVGDTVSAGQTIGTVGKTGKAMGMHLHFEVRVGGGGYFDVRNPELWFAPHEGNGVLVGKIINPDGEIRYYPDIKVEYLVNIKKPPVYRPEPYADTNLKSDEFYQEVFAIGDLPAGRYRISFTPPGVTQVMEVEIMPGKVTQVILHAKY